MTIADIAHLDITDEQLVQSAARELAVLATTEPAPPPWDWEADLDARMQKIRDEVIYPRAKLLPQPAHVLDERVLELANRPVEFQATWMERLLDGLIDSMFGLLGCVCTPGRGDIFGPQ
jgi:hypothetical protein